MLEKQQIILNPNYNINLLFDKISQQHLLLQTAIVLEEKNMFKNVENNVNLLLKELKKNSLTISGREYNPINKDFPRDIYYKEPRGEYSQAKLFLMRGFLNEYNKNKVSRQPTNHLLTIKHILEWLKVPRDKRFTYNIEALARDLVNHNNVEKSGEALTISLGRVDEYYFLNYYS